ncbi:MAG: hypothetical protein J6M22_03615, partial [Firmicutes bacterium]|nr:hypothetical protein [Bacillota bacterium]
MNNIIVNESSSNIRLLARQALDGQWKKVTLAVIIYMIAIMVPTLILEVIFGSLNPENLEAAMYSTDFPAEMFAGSTISSV